MSLWGNGFARVPSDPKPELVGLLGVREDDEVLVTTLRHFPLNLQAGGSVWYLVAVLSGAVVHYEPPLQADGLQFVLLFRYGDGKIAGGEVPTQFLGENAGKICLPQPVLDGLLVDLHGDL
jgi:hypothetical protein